ncbi:MAG: hypothetical protein ACJAVV_001797 [Alphaproteobacteria bacterium]|jgi:hypothetical protein
MTKLLKALFKRRHPFAPVAYMGRKNFEKTMDCKVMKRKDLEKLADQENHPQG